MTKHAKIITVLLTGIFVIAFTMFGVMAARTVSTLPLGQQVTIGELDAESEQIGLMNILVIGIDEDGTRSDTIMLLCYDGYSNRFNILSLPRDTQVVMNGYKQKLNAAVGVGLQNVKDGKDSEQEEELIRQVKKLTGLPVHYFVTVDFTGFKEIIDALGGVEFNIPYDMDYDDPVQNLHIHLKKGQQHLDGQAAHDFVRFRHNNDGSAPGEYVMGDEGRIYWQQRFLKALLAQKAKPQYFTKITDVFDAVVDNVRTNYTLQDLLAHIDVIQEINIDEIEAYRLPGEAAYVESDQLWWYLYDEDAGAELIRDVFMPKSMEQWEAEKAARAEKEMGDGDNGAFGSKDGVEAVEKQ